MPDKRAMWQARMGLCDYCRLEMPPTDIGCHIHHGLIYKNELPRSKQETEAGSINEQINLFLVHTECHDALQSDRQWCLEQRIAEYGIDEVEDYLKRMKPKTYQGVGRC